MEEIWKDIINYDGLYQVSNTGYIKSLDGLSWNGYSWFTKKGRILKAQNVGKGYLAVGLSNGNGSKRKYVHRLVAEAFISNSENKPNVNHIDGNKKNNTSDNLEWVTQQENINHSINILGNTQIGSLNNNSKLSEIDVINIKNDNRTHKIIADEYGVARTTITMIKTLKNRNY